MAVTEGPAAGRSGGSQAQRAETLVGSWRVHALGGSPFDSLLHSQLVTFSDVEVKCKLA